MAKVHKRILVIDDDKAILELVDQALSSHYQVTCLEDWLEGIQMLTSQAFDLLILDLAMPVFSPDEFLSRFHELRNQAQVPVLVISAHSNLRARLNNGQVNAVLSKPFLIQELLNTVDGLVSV